VIHYHISGGKDLSSIAKYIDDDSNPIPTLDALRIRGYALMANYNCHKKDQEGKKRKFDISCGSTFMTEIVPKIGNAIRDTYYWVLPGATIYLYLDNDGGHGTNEVVDTCVKVVKDNYNIECIHQRHCLPATNMQDLGVWMAFQCVIEK